LLETFDGAGFLADQDQLSERGGKNTSRQGAAQ
jgi:hypothetical protein